MVYMIIIQCEILNQFFSLCLCFCKVFEAAMNIQQAELELLFSTEKHNSIQLGDEFIMTAFLGVI